MPARSLGHKIRFFAFCTNPIENEVRAESAKWVV